MTRPPVFLKALALMSALTFDVGVFSGVFCLAKLSFFANLIVTTTGLVVLVVAFYLIAILKPAAATTCRKLAVYLLLFAYPVVSVKVVEAFSCHEVEGDFRLRADYSIICYSQSWNYIAGYASIFVMFYVALLPGMVLSILFRYRKLVRDRKVAPANLSCSFLLEDYKLVFPCVMW